MDRETQQICRRLTDEVMSRVVDAMPPPHNAVDGRLNRIRLALSAADVVDIRRRALREEFFIELVLIGLRQSDDSDLDGDARILYRFSEPLPPRIDLG